MRATTLLRKLSRLYAQHTVVTGFEFTSNGRALVVDVRPTTRAPCCGSCLQRCAHGYDHRERLWRHTDLGETKVHLRYAIARVDCERCGPTTELVPWAAHAAWHTYDFENLVAYKAQGSDRSRVAKDMRVNWETVGNIVTRVVDRLRAAGDDLLDDLRNIGLDELSYRKGHNYISIVVDHDRECIVWAGEGRTGETVGAFFEKLGPERAAQLEHVSIDMSAAYEAAVRKYAPNAEIVFDRFHVQQLAHHALDEVRREVVRELKGTAEGKAIKGLRWPLQRNEVNHTPKDQERISTVMQTNAPLFRAYMLKTMLVWVLSTSTIRGARRKLESWIAWAVRSQLKPFVRVGKTIRRHLEGILAYIRTGISNGRSEGMNRKARVITSRAFGFHSATPLIASLFLCCSGLKLEPRHA